MSKYENFKDAITGVVSASVGLVIQTVIAKNTPVDLPYFPKLGMKVGTLVIGSLLSNMAATKITDGLDNIVSGVKKGVEEAEAELKEQSFTEMAEDALNITITEPADVPKPKRKPTAKKPPETTV